MSKITLINYGGRYTNTTGDILYTTGNICPMAYTYTLIYVIAIYIYTLGYYTISPAVYIYLYISPGICNSCLMVFTVHGICTMQGLYVLLRALHTALARYLSHALKKPMRQLTCTDKANRQISFGARMSSTYCM